MAVAEDAVGPSSAGTSTSGTSLSWSHTCGASVTHLVVVTVNGSASEGSDTCKYAGVSMTLLGRVYSNEAGSNTAGYVSLWGLASPATGTNTVQYTSHASDLLIGGGVSYTGGGSFGTAVTNSGSSGAPSASVTGTTSGGMVTAGACYGSPLQTPTQTSRWICNVNGNTAANNGAQQDAASTGGTVTLAWKDNSDWFGAVAVEVLPGGSTTHDAAASWTGSGTFTATAQKTAPGAAAWSGSGSLTATARKSAPAAAAWSGDGSLTATAQKTAPAAAAWSGSGSLTAAAVRQVPAAASWSGAGAFTATAAVAGEHAAAAAWTGSGTFTAAAVKRVPSAAAWSGSGSLAASPAVSRAAAVAWSGSGSLTATAGLPPAAGRGVPGGVALAAVPGGSALAAVPGATIDATAVPGGQ